MQRRKPPINPFGLPNIVIPAEVVFNEELTWREKALFGFISNLTSNERGYCWASNQYISQLIGTRADTTSTMISKLQKHGYIKTQHEKRDDGSQVRKIMIDHTYPQKHQKLLQKALGKNRGVGEITSPHRVNTLTPEGKSQRNIYNKELNNKELYNSPRKKSMDERNEKFTPLSEKLADIVKTAKNIKVNKNKLKRWSNEIRLLSESDGVDPDRIEKALDWYAEKIGGEYIPVIESGQSLRHKFIRLEEAIKRDGGLPTPKTNNENPRKIIYTHFRNKDIAKAFTNSCFMPAKVLYNGIDQGKVAKALLQFYDQVKTFQEKNFDETLSSLLPGPMGIIENYIQWIKDNSGWIKTNNVNQLSVSHGLFSKYRRQEASSDNLERDPLTGLSCLE